MQILQASDSDLMGIARLAQLLWPHHSQGELAEEFQELLNAGRTAVFLAYEQSSPVAFAQCSIRTDYVEGTEGGPVGYLEGVFVLPEWRRKGIAKALIQTCEAWAQGQGCRQLASDCELGNDDSLSFHLGSGFTEANRIICFVKDIV